MSDTLPIILFGAGGRMGRMVLDILAGMAPGPFTVAGAVETAEHPWVGEGLGQMIPGHPEELVVSADAPPDPPAGAVAIHFDLPEGTMRSLAWSRTHALATLICTTGFDEAQRAEIDAAGADAPILFAPNTSLGVNTLFWLVEQATRLLGPDYDIEIVEMHHHHKQDAPSGTARRLGEIVTAARGGEYLRDVRHGREGQVGVRSRAEVGMHALRGGDVVGEHTVIMAGPSERVELTHRAHSRELFARGALRAAQWLSGREPGLYTMRDVLGL